MKKALTAILLLVFAAAHQPSANAQSIPFLSELFSRYEEFSKLYNQRQQSGASLSAVDAIRGRAETAFKRMNIPGLLEALGEATAALKGSRWDEQQKFVASLTLEADRLVVEPNQVFEVSLVRMFPSNLDKAFASTPTVTFEVVAADPSATRLPRPVVIAERLQVAEASSNANRRLLLPDGAYWVVARVEASGQRVAELKRPVYAISDFSDTIAQMAKLVATVKQSADPKVKAVAVLVATPEFQLQRLAPLNRSVGEVEVNPIGEIDRITDELSALSKGENPMAAERGELERAYVASDGKLVPYRVYVPRSYTGASARPMVVMLHGALGDERYYFSGLFDPDVIKGEAERRGIILAAPTGRSRFPTYRDLGQEDVFEVMKAVGRDYKIDASRVYLTGHSMGGFGAWLIAASRPELFAAMAPVSGGSPAPDAAQLAALLEKLKAIPALVVHGARDGIVPPARSRDMASAAQKAGMKVTLLENPNADHVTVVAATFPAILDFFEKNARQPR
jgi:pimeloyl-ACP methyl ester carboxylesterase